MTRARPRAGPRHWTRRRFLNYLLAVGAGAGGLPLTGVGSDRVSQSDPAARALGYHHDADAVDADKYPSYEPGRTCADCRYLSGDENRTWRPCEIFNDRLVHSGGWCKSWQAPLA